MGVTIVGDLQEVGIDVDVILENCTITFVYKLRIQRNISTRLVI